MERIQLTNEINIQRIPSQFKVSRVVNSVQHPLVVKVGQHLQKTSLLPK